MAKSKDYILLLIVTVVAIVGIICMIISTSGTNYKYGETPEAGLATRTISGSPKELSGNHLSAGVNPREVINPVIGTETGTSSMSIQDMALAKLLAEKSTGMQWEELVSMPEGKIREVIEKDRLTPEERVFVMKAVLSEKAKKLGLN